MSVKIDEKTTWKMDLDRAIKNVKIGLELMVREYDDSFEKVSPNALWIAEGDLMLALELLRESMRKLKDAKKENS